jgi:uncharacterized protein (TIGR02300 family)
MTPAMSALSNKEARGTKRLCQECQVRFYDLRRDPILCPSCGAQHVPVVQPVVQAGRRGPAAKSGWRQPERKPDPVPAVPDAENVAPPEAAAGDELEATTEEAANTSTEDDVVLEPEADESDLSDLVEIDVEDPKES